MIDVKISKKLLSLKKSSSWIDTDGIGCMSIFVGVVRVKNKGKIVKYLKFEVYEKMAINKMQEIAEKAEKRFGLNNVLIYHRVGKVKVGQIPVIIAVSSSHRRPAIQACQYLIDTLKATVPIWKKEVYEGGEEWVSAHP